MKQIPVSELKPGMVFDEPVFIDGKDILLSAFQPLKLATYERLKNWGVHYIYTNGKVLNEQDAEEELKELISDLVEKQAPEISELYYISP